MTFTRANYKNTIDNLNVTSNSKYQPTSSATYCNIFAQDVCKACGTPLPSGTCKTMLNTLYGNKTAHWYSVDYKTAYTRANAGYPTIGITSDHIVVIYPSGSTPTAVKDLYMSMAGYKCFNNTKITYAWTTSALANVKFYSYYEKN